MNLAEYLKFQEKMTTVDRYDGSGANGGRGVGTWLTPQVVYSNPEYTVISETDETVFVEDETGAPHVFTREEWQKMQGTGTAGLAVLGAAAAALLLLA